MLNALHLSCKDQSHIFKIYSYMIFVQNGLNALHLSCKEGHLHIVNDLLARGAKIDAATKKVSGSEGRVSTLPSLFIPFFSMIFSSCIFSCKEV